MKTFLTWHITEGSVDVLGRMMSRAEIGRFQNHLGRVMPKQKVNHSLRVGATMVKAGAPHSAIKAALFHDYLERGGSPEKMHKVIHSDHETKAMIHALSSSGKDAARHSNEPLEHLKHTLSQPMHPDTKNHIILIKLADRLDNLKKRAKAGGVGENYRQKSKDLIRHLTHHYTGNRDNVMKLKPHFAEHGIIIKKRHLPNAL
jgi:(p)ppGpp synthase/HD superfamily hydrolase